MPDWITKQDVDNFGRDLIEVAQRASLDALTPAMQQIVNEQEALRQRLAVEARRKLDMAVEREIPDFRTRDQDPEWHRWLLGVDPMSGRIRQVLLNDAIASGSTARVVAFFKGYEHSHVHQTSTTAAQRRASAPSGKHVYSRQEIGRLYEQNRKGEFDPATWERIEADIFAAQRENRISGTYLTK